MVREVEWLDFLELCSELPIADVRSELEFTKGHIPEAINIPLLNNSERIAVGTDYKQKGKNEAIKTGFRLVGPRLNEIIEAAEKISNTKDILVHCWRGGMRSSNFSQFIDMAGLSSHILKGGYKTYRQKAHEYFKKPFSLILISGCTGSGKTEVLNTLRLHGEQVIDLEGIANHKGSAFGGLMMPAQPTTEQFENFLFEQLRGLNIYKPIWVEDESIAVGKIFLPNEFWKNMRQSPVAVMNVDKSVRIKRLVDEYGHSDRAEFLEAMSRITKKLGGQHFKAAKQKLEQNEMSAVMEILLTYYDKAYLSSLEKRKPERIGEIDWNGMNPSEAAKKLIELGKQNAVV